MPLRIISLPSLEEFESQGTSGLWFIFEESWDNSSPAFYSDLQEIKHLISWLAYIETEDQDKVLKSNPWIMECLSYEPRLISTIKWKRAGPEVFLNTDLETLKLIVTKLKVAGKLP